ncbi:hypothetical protein [Streptomyces sp. NBC_00827]|uniref:hypothetical protein n=1 Tax=Streptomyces sp. NBC_00827 TaxID=2903677 RepID=UPI00386A4353|nr:LysM peptidoglycan-binding domain-containing protein [Streptomyces sp. NBC_00827]
MRTTHSPAATATTLGRVLRAVLSLLVLGGVVAGLPLLLAWVTPVIWQASHDDLTHLLDRQDTGAAFLVLLVALGWIGWAQFTFCAAGELIAQLRGRTWHAPRGLGSSQHAAALLVGSILVLLPASSALASDAQAAPATAAARLPGQAPQTGGAHQSAAAAASTPKPHTYTVRETRPAESLWSIAERELGSGERWREIAALNEGRTMADGQVFKATSFLQPRWQLAMPDTAASAGGARTQWNGGAPSAAEESEHVVTVESGDYLSKIAAEELGDGNQWPELFKASQNKPQPHGLPEITNPDAIYAGQQVTVPDQQPDQHDRPQDDAQEEDAQEDGPREEPGNQQQTPPAAEDPHDGPEADQDQENVPAPTPSQSATPTPQSSASSGTTQSPSQQPRQEQGASSTTARPPASASAAAPASPSASPSDASSAATASPTPASSPAAGSPLQLRTALGAGALLAAAVTAALALRRLLQRRRRTPGETIAIAPETSAAEAQLAAVAEPGGAARLDMALRTLAHRVAQDGDQVLPGLRAARIGARSLEVLPEDLAETPLAPFAVGQAGWWLLPADAQLLDEEAAREVPAPYPGLVTVGSTESGELVLLNLTQLPALLLDGNPVHITEVCTSLALEFGMSPWATEVEVVTVGFGEDLPQLLPTSRIAHMRHPAHALRDLSERLLEAQQLPESDHQPYLLLCASALDPDTAWQFADLIDKAGRIPVTLIAPAGDTAAHFPDAEILNASLDVPQQLPYVGADITLQRLEHAAYQQITTALAVSGQGAHPAQGAWRDVPDEPGPGQQPPPPASDDQATSPEAGADLAAAAATNRDSGSGVFPALLAASTDPAGLHLLPAPRTPPQAHAGPAGPGAIPAGAPLEATSGPQDAEEPPPAAAAGQDLAEDIAVQELHAPEIRVLGPLEVTGVASTGHGPGQARLAALLYFRPGRSADVLCADMDPASPWTAATLNARMQGLRRALGNDPAGNAYVPRRRSGEDPYQLAASVRCDWTRFVELAERALPHGPAGLPDLERALGLVRGRPFGTRPLPWAEPYQQEMITRIIDVAHAVATHRTPPGPHHDLIAARHAITTGLGADDSAELLYRDWMRIEHAAGNRPGLHTAITRIQQINRALDCSLESETEQLIHTFLHPAHAEQTRGR